MNDGQFDAWTRRRITLAAGGVAAAMVGRLAPERVAAKKRKKKIRCRTLLQSCAHQGKEQHCCSGLNCDAAAGQTTLTCCFGRQHRCQSAGECCGGFLCSEVERLVGNRCCGNFPALCTSDDDCCFGAPCVQGVCAAISDRARKANFASVNPADMLQRVRELPISTWNYTADDPSVRHIGPMAQDFAAAFGVGADDRHIHPLDGQGIALAAIQGLIDELGTLREENARLVARVAALETSRESETR